ncbi:MAG: hypothetical protein K6F27_02710 [Ruminococcus sp.]|nr:hypothetical protein [Ruminococcus sp.]
MIITVEGGKISKKEQEAYAEYARNKHPDMLITSMKIQVNGEYVDLTCYYDAVSFQRIRRITGYLVGDLGRFNDAKYAEVEDRVSHDMSQSM